VSDIKVFNLPDLGEGLTEAEVVRWLVSAGDTIAIDQPVVEVETAKAVVEVPSPFGGVVSELHGAAGDVLNVGAPLISVATALSQLESRREEEKAGSGNVLVGYGTKEHGRRRRARAGASATASLDVKASVEKPRVISPVVRRLARERGIDIANLRGTGPDGLILRRDVESAGVTPAPSLGLVTAEGVERIPLKGVRRTVADKLTRSRREIPDASTWVDVDATGLLDARAAINATHPGRKVSLLALVARFCVAGLQRFGELNASVDTDRDEIVRYSHINLSFAAQTDRGLVVPVVHGAQSMTTLALSDEMARLTDEARGGKLAPADMTGGTFTVNNYGVFGVDGSTPIINYPEAAILGIGRIVDKPWVVDGQLAVRKVTQLSLSFDHRVCDGGVAGGFLRFVADCVERPAGLLGDL
jgi:pyruvate dehydrogenase E2 component (dihydrolipoamide acetyltransferase)